MSVAVRGRVPVKWEPGTARHITERLQALERAISGGTPVYVAPSVPTFGTGTIPGGGGGSGGSGGGPGGSGTSDHGALSGLEDDDHPQYAHQLESAATRAHVHGPDDVLLLDQRFVRKGEPARPTPHSHTMGDVADLRPDDSQFVIAYRMFGRR